MNPEESIKPEAAQNSLRAEESTQIRKTQTPRSPSQTYQPIQSEPQYTKQSKGILDKKLIITAIIIIIVLVALFLTIKFWPSESATVGKAETTEEPTAEADIPIITAEEGEKLLAADEEYLIANYPETPDDCLGLSSLSRAECYQTIAYQNDDVSVCENILLDEELPDFEYERCRFEVLSVTDNEEACAQLENATYEEYNADACNTRMYILSGDPANCDKLKLFTGPNSQNECYMRIAAAKGNPELCNNMSNLDEIYTKASCFKQAALTSGNETICENIEYPTGEDSKFECISEIAVSYNRPELCEQLPDRPVLNNKQDCLEAVEAQTV